MEVRNRPPHVLFISHEAGRSGAPLALLHLVRWLKNHSSITFEILCLGDGPLVRDFASVAPVTVVDRSWSKWFIQADWAAAHGTTFFAHPAVRVVARITAALRRWALRRDFGELDRFCLIYANSAVSAACFDALPSRRPPIVTHVHELSYSLRHLIPATSLDRMLRSSDRYIACSTAVRDTLVGEHGVPSERVRVVYSPVDTRELDSASGRSRRKQVLAEVGIPEDAVIVGACGSREWRKGTDLFAQLSVAVKAKLGPIPVFFMWVGGLRPGASDAAFRYDFDKLGLDETVRLIDTVPDPHRYFSVFDVFVLTSREDPFPLTALEAAAMGIPVVGFDSGGLKEMLSEDAGRVVDYADITSMAENVIELLADPALSQEIGSKGAARVRERYDIELIGPALLRIIDDVAVSTGVAFAPSTEGAAAPRSLRADGTESDR